MTASLLYLDDHLELRRLAVGPLRTNCHTIVCRRSGSTVKVDPGDEPERIVAAVDGRSVTAQLLTHAHWDHVQAADGLRSLTGAPVRAHAAEHAVWRHELEHLRRHGQWDWAQDADRAPAGPTPAPGWDRKIDEPLDDGERLQVGQLSVQGVLTPGHSPGSLCLRVGDHLLTGDTLFPGGPGLTGWPLSDFPSIIASVERLLALPPHLRLRPGHGPGTTVGRERPSSSASRERGW
jgi:glyoxylase-like metal-dependent hydrolase (beta-lactamase superfamily II)